MSIAIEDRVVDWFSRLGLDLGGIVAGAVTYEDLAERTARAKRDAEANYRRLSKRAHPDVLGDHDEMVRLNEAIEGIRGLRIQRPAPVRHVVLNVVISWRYGGFTATSASTVSPTGG